MFIRGLLGVDSWKKNRYQQISYYSSFKELYCLSTFVPTSVNYPPLQCTLMLAYLLDMLLINRALVLTHEKVPDRKLTLMHWVQTSGVPLNMVVGLLDQLSQLASHLPRAHLGCPLLRRKSSLTLEPGKICLEAGWFNTPAWGYATLDLK